MTIAIIMIIEGVREEGRDWESLLDGRATLRPPRWLWWRNPWAATKVCHVHISWIGNAMLFSFFHHPHLPHPYQAAPCTSPPTGQLPHHGLKRTRSKQSQLKKRQWKVVIMVVMLVVVLVDDIGNANNWIMKLKWSLLWSCLSFCLCTLFSFIIQLLAS